MNMCKPMLAAILAALCFVVGWHEPLTASNVGSPASIHSPTAPGSIRARASKPIGSTVTAVAVGLAHSCALLSNGEVHCWGDNTYGQLGNGSHADARVGSAVRGLKERIIDISAGGYHTCALDEFGSVWCWGSNYQSQLGQIDGFESTVPVEVKGLTQPAKMISAGGSHTCALVEEGGVKCWGDNAYGQLGNGSREQSATPVTVRNLPPATTISAGSGHTCAITNEGVWCWGNNIFGQLGDRTTRDRHTPVQVAALTDAVAISAGGMHTCALLTTGAVKCWGFNAHGQLGDGTTLTRLSPVTVLSREPIKQLAAGALHTCAVHVRGDVRCWGFNRQGQLGDSSYVDRITPTLVLNLGSPVTSISAGGAHTCALSWSGLACWGQNACYQLGDGTSEDSNVPLEAK